jgi:hypothetical protein
MTEPQYFLKVELPAQELLDDGTNRPQAVRAEIDDGYYPSQYLGLIAPWHGRRWTLGIPQAKYDDVQIKTCLEKPSDADWTLPWLDALRQAQEELAHPPDAPAVPWKAELDVWFEDTSDGDTHNDWGQAELTLEPIDDDELTHLCIEHGQLMIVVSRDQLTIWIATFERALAILRAIHDVTSQMDEVTTQEVRANVARVLAPVLPPPECPACGKQLVFVYYWQNTSSSLTQKVGWDGQAFTINPDGYDWGIDEDGATCPHCGENVGTGDDDGNGTIVLGLDEVIKEE